MTATHTDTWDIIEGIDIDHLDDRPDELHHVAVEEGPNGDLRALPFTADKNGYTEIDVNLMAYDKVVRYVEMATDHDRRIDFTRIPTATVADGIGW
jgi:hypothetical protein